MTALPPDVVADLRLENARLQAENARLFNETQEALERQTASSEILRVIASTTNDAEHSLQQIAETTARLFGASSVQIRIARGDEWSQTINVGPSGKRISMEVSATQLRLGARNLPSTVLGENRQVHIPDLDNPDPEIADWPGIPPARAAGTRALSGTPLRREGKAIGVLIVHRDRPEPFTAEELALQQSFADQAVIAIENARLFNETEQALARQTATSDILRVISQSPTDVQPVFDAIVLTAGRLLRCDRAFIQRSDATGFWTVASADSRGPLPITQFNKAPIDPDANFPSRAIVAKKTLHLPDWSAIELPEFERHIRERHGTNAALYMPLLREGECIGLLAIIGKQAGMFGENDIALAESFRDQALIAIENTRLFNETKEALERQTATAEILKVIASSPSDTTPVFQAIATSASRLLGGFSTAAFRFLDGSVHLAAFTPVSPVADAALKADFPKPVDEFEGFQLAQQGKPFPITDTEEIPHPPELREIARLHGFRSMLFVPLMNGGVPIGIISVTRREPGAFSPNHIQLLQTFADQAVIAIENARLFHETREALERQTATADILKVIASSPDDVRPVFDAIVNSAAKLFEPCSATITTLKDGKLHWNAVAELIPSFDHKAAEATYPIPFDPGRSPSARAILERRIIQIPDIKAADTPEFTQRAAAAGGFRNIIFVPLISENNGIGTIILTHPQAGYKFSDRQLALLQTFADQAVIAIENVRLFNETQEALERQTATAEILKVIASSPSDVQPVFNAIASSANALLGGLSTAVHTVTDDTLHLMAFTPTNPAGDAQLQASYPRPLSALPWGAQLREGEIVLVGDTEVEWTALPGFRDVARMRGFRSILRVPLLRDGTTIGAINVTRTEPGQFARHHIQLLQTFADQAVIAIENVRLFNETQEALKHQTATSEVLQAIGSSMADRQPVFERILDSTERLFDCRQSAIFLAPGDGLLHLAARHGVGSEALDHVYPLPIKETMAPLVIGEQRQIFVPDALNGEDIPPSLRRVVQAVGNFSVVMTPMIWEGQGIGMISVVRDPNTGLTPKELGLLKTFADQAVIAIQNSRLFNETREALERQTATADILKVIASSPSDVQPVFDVIVERAVRLCGARMGRVYRYDDGMIHMVAGHNLSTPGLSKVQEVFPRPAADDTTAGLAIRSRQPYFVTDIESDQSAPPLSRQMIEALGTRSQVTVPMLRKDEPIGAITVGWAEPAAYGDQQVALLQTFADQAVIAIENVRLFNETREALERQTATADILKVIASSPSDVQPVFEAIATSANRLIGGFSSTVFRFIDGVAHLKAFTPTTPAADQVLQATFPRPVADFPPFKMAQAGEVTQIPDTEALSDELLDIARARGYRSMLFTPLMNDGVSIGFITVTRVQPGAFADHHVQLLRTFADQAVIAIENVRLFDEVQAKTRDLTEALTYQTGSSNILKVIASSPTDVGPVLKAIVESACELCDAHDAVVRLRDGDDLLFSAHHGPIPTSLDKWPINRNWITGRAVMDKMPIHVHDLLSAEGNEFPEAQQIARRQGHRTILSVPLLRENGSIGAIVLRRTEVAPFGEKQIALLQTFADQAVIALDNVRLFDEVQARTRELTEALTYQTGSANILRVIASSPTEVGPVLEAIVASACELCDAVDALVLLKDGDNLRHGAHHGPIPYALEKWPINRNWASACAFLDRKPVHVHDVFSAEGDEFPDTRERARRTGTRTYLCVPLLREGESIGTIVLRRTEVHPFNEKQIALLQTFADQAVIAIGNVRLFDEVQAKTRDLTEALTYQTGSSNILKVIASSPTDVGPVLKAIVESACELCEADDALVTLRDGDDLLFKAQHGSIPVAWERMPINRQWASGRAVVDRKPVHVHDLHANEGEPFPDSQELARRTSVRTVLSVPLLRENESIGAIVLRRTEVQPFSDKQISLLQTFADQAVIAIGNVRLFDEVQARTEDLRESLQVQTATSEVLRVISRSPDALQPVLDAIVETSRELCGSDGATIFLLRERKFHFTAASGAVPKHLEFLRTNPAPIDGPTTVFTRVAQQKRTTHYPHVTDDPELQGRSDRGGPRALLVAPLMRDGEVIGTIILRQSDLKPFTPRQIEAIETFADQAVIAISNVGLFEQVQERTRDLTESLQQQTATADVLKVISRSTFDLKTVLDALIGSAAQLCDANAAHIYLREAEVYKLAACAGFSDEYEEFMRAHTLVPGRGTLIGRTALEGRIVRIPDALNDSEYEFRDAQSLGGFRTMLGIPMLRDGAPIGVLAMTRSEVRPFTDKQIDLVTTFADQAVIAIENVRLFVEVQERTKELSQSLDDLRTAQDRLVQTEKLASLGQLTAGIAHEIKNPLNFVNNFSALSAELTDELNDLLRSAVLTDKLREEVDELTETLKDNLQKVVQHGKRADSIVKNMLLHSREGSGEHRPADINAILDESLNLAYHGARAEKREFNVTLQRDFDEMAGTIEVFPQEITRVFLNLISNGFYAVAKRKTENGGSDFEPVVRATTRSLGDTVEIRIRDNGTGIPAEVREKMFNPFFTTKPAGEGTGLGLSMSHDIIVKQHGGRIDVETEPGQFTEFRIVLPRTKNLSDKNRGQT